jgi:Protein of unknown function (DUF520)
VDPPPEGRCSEVLGGPDGTIFAMPTFDIVSEVDMQEVRNAVDQANREASTRFDFKNTDSVKTSSCSARRPRIASGRCARCSRKRS